jgi:hypothetical protein
VVAEEAIVAVVAEELIAPAVAEEHIAAAVDRQYAPGAARTLQRRVAAHPMQQFHIAAVAVDMLAAAADMPAAVDTQAVAVVDTLAAAADTGNLLILQLNTVMVPHPFPRFLRKWVGIDATVFLPDQYS